MISIHGEDHGVNFESLEELLDKIRELEMSDAQTIRRYYDAQGRLVMEISEDGSMTTYYAYGPEDGSVTTVVNKDGTFLGAKKTFEDGHEEFYDVVREDREVFRDLRNEETVLWAGRENNAGLPVQIVGILKRSRPSVGVQINDGSTTTDSRDVEVKLNINDSLINAGLSALEDYQIRIAVNGFRYGAYRTVRELIAAGIARIENGAVILSQKIPAHKGMNYINVQIKDPAGNTGFVYSRIAYEPHPRPAAANGALRLQINAGAETTASRTVELKLDIPATASLEDYEVRVAINGFQYGAYRIVRELIAAGIARIEDGAVFLSQKITAYKGMNYINVETRAPDGNVRFAYAKIIYSPEAAHSNV